ncbi:unnamed protein product, partial [Effrenium voratum]
ALGIASSRLLLSQRDNSLWPWNDSLDWELCFCEPGSGFLGNDMERSQALLKGRGFERQTSRNSAPGEGELLQVFNWLRSSWKAMLTTFVALAVALVIHFSMPFVHPSRYVIMGTTVVDYPQAFEVPSEYNPDCDTRSSDFRMGNRAFLEELEGFSFVFFSVASIVNMATEIIKTASAVLMPPVKPIPDADQFIPDVNQPNCVALRRCPGNRFVTLGSLVPGPQELWRSGPFAKKFQPMAKSLISLVQGELQGQRPEGAEFCPSQSVNVLMEAPHGLKIAGISGMTIFMPWTMQTACFLYPIQLVSLLYDLIADSFLRSPDYMSILSDSNLWWQWLLLSFRHEMLLPVLLQVLRIHISIDNLGSFLRGSEGTLIGKRMLAFACAVALLPKLMIFLPALLVTFLIGLFPTWLAAQFLERTTGKSYWYGKDGPHLVVLYCFVLPSASVVNALFYSFSGATYLCTHAKANLLPLREGHWTMDAPLICFLASMFFWALALVVPLKLFLTFFPETSGRGFISFLSPSGFYLRWLENPLYDTSSLRLDREGYEEHRRHFLKAEAKEECRYCQHINNSAGDVLATHFPAQSFIYDGMQQCWEFPCLHNFIYNAQKGASSAAELIGVIERLRERQSVRRLRAALDEAQDFADGLQQAEQLRRTAQVVNNGHIVIIDGVFGPHTKKALLEFLMQQGEIPRTNTPKGGFGQEAMKGLQSFLKRLGFYTGPLHGQLDDCWTIRALRSWLMDLGHFHERWLSDGDCSFGRWTTIALQRFLVSTHERAKGIRHLAVDGQWTVETVFAFEEFLARTGTATPRTGTWQEANTRALQEFLKRRGYLEKDQPLATEMDPEVCAGLQAWLRDQGFPCGLEGKNADGVDGILDTATCIALQLFLNSERAGFIDKDLVIDGKWKEITIRRLQEMLAEDNLNVEVTGSWDVVTRQALQGFLKAQGRYVSFLDGDFGGVSVKSLQAWLRDEGFSCGNDGPRGDGVSGVWNKATTAALQKFLNSRKASICQDARYTTVPEQHDLEASCWALALFGGAEEAIDEDALNMISVLGPDLLENGRKTAKARLVLRENNLPVPCEWWGTAQLLANLGDAAWVQAANSDAAVAAVRALRSLEEVDEAPQGVWEMGVAVLLGHLRDGSAATVEVVCHALGTLTDTHLLRVEVHDCARKVLAARLRANASIHQAIARGLVSMRTLIPQLWPVLRERLSSPDGLDVKIAAEALAALHGQQLLPEQVLSSCVEVLGERLLEEDWIVRVAACRGLASFGTQVAGPYLDQILRVVDDDEGPVVAAAAYAVSVLVGRRRERMFQLQGVMRRLQMRLADGESDSWVRAGACQGLGHLGIATEDTVAVLSSQFTDSEGIVVEAAAEAMCSLHLWGAIETKVLDEEARKTAQRLGDENWLTRWASCVCLGALGVAALPYIQDLQDRFEDEDENGFVHDAARMSLNRPDNPAERWQEEADPKASMREVECNGRGNLGISAFDNFKGMEMDQ